MNKNKRKMTFKPGTAKRFFKYLYEHNKRALRFVSFSILITSVVSVFSSVMLQRIIDDVIEPGLLNGYDSISTKLITYIIIMAAVYAISIILTYAYTQTMAKVTQSTIYDLRVDLFDKMQDLPINYYDTHQHGDIMSTYTNDTDALRQLIGQVLPQIIQSVITITAIVVMMIGYSLWLSLFVAIVIFFMLQIVKKIAGGSAKYMMKQQKSLAKEEGFIEEYIQGIKVVKVFNHENETKENFNTYNEQLFEDSKKANTYSNILMPIMGNVGNILYVCIAFIGGILLIGQVKNISLFGYDVLTVGIIVAYLTFVRTLSQTIGRISSQVGMVTMGLSGVSRIFDLLDEMPESDNGFVKLVQCNKDKKGHLVESKLQKDAIWAWKVKDQKTSKVSYVELKGEIVFKDVNFSYVENKPILKNINLYAKAGQKIALVGATGAGKTTITNLINRFYDINQGIITYDGIPIKNICKPDLRKSLGVVLQDVNLFTGTVMENIRYGRLNASDEACIKAAKKANAHDFITRLPQGYQTMLNGSGANLSQGQRQLISIARAEIANHPVMILDEATSSIDTRTEILVQKGMDTLMENRTVFVIAHRLSTVRNSDHILVLDHGEIIERGTHEALLDQKGIYYQLYTGAFELE